MAEETRSLWEQLDSDVEPWRRGRVVLVLIALLNFVVQALVIAAVIIIGDVTRLISFATASVLFWLTFYFIWIGIHWVRFLAGGWTGVVGFCFLIWAIRDGNPYEAIGACLNLLIGTYLCLSPSVYFFAKRQQERRGWTQSLLVAAVFGLLLMTLYAGTSGLVAYKMQLERQARSFGDEAFRRLFAEHDTYFFIDRLTEEALARNGGRAHATKFLQGATVYAGDVHDIQPAAAELKITFRWPANLDCIGTLRAEAVGQRGPVQLQMSIVRSGEDWQINDVLWGYRDHQGIRHR